MKLICRIALNEFRYYFYSPIGWFVLIFFVFIFGGVFLLGMYNNTYMQEAMIAATKGKWDGFKGISVTIDRVDITLKFLISYYYLFIPLITMNLISKEFSNGTIKLINSSPITTFRFIIGKYMGVLLFLFMVLGIFSLMALVGVSRIVNADYPYFFTTVLSLVMMTIVFVAIGMFISSLSTYPIVAVCGTLVVLMGLNNMGTAFQKVDGLREAFYFMSFSGRTESFLKGVITSRDIIYHLVVSALFIYFTLVRVNNQFRRSSLLNSSLRFGCSTLIAALVIVVASARGNVWYYDATRLKINTASDKVQDALAQLDGSPLKITLYTNLLGNQAENGLPQNRNDYLWNFWQRYFRHYKNVEFNYVNYYSLPEGDSSLIKQYPKKSLGFIAGKVAEILDTDIDLYKSAGDIKAMRGFDRKSSGILYFTLEYKGKQTIVRTFPDMQCWPHDIHMAAAFKTLVTDTVPRLKFLSGHYERNPHSTGERNYSAIFTDAKSRYSAVATYIQSEEITEVRPSRFHKNDLLVIADPKSELSPSLTDSIKSYIDNGGNALILGEPGKSAIINPVLNHFGASLELGTLVWQNPNDLPVNMNLNHTPTITRLAKEPLLEGYRHGMVDSIYATISSSSYIRQINNAFRMDTIFYVKRAYYNPWMKMGRIVSDSATPVFSEAAGDYRLNNNYLVAADFTRTVNNKEQRIIVMADADYYSNLKSYLVKAPGAFYSYLFNNEYPPYSRFDVPIDSFMKGTAKTTGLIAKGLGLVFPLGLTVTAIIILIRRKRK